MPVADSAPVVTNVRQLRPLLAQEHTDGLAGEPGDFDLGLHVFDVAP